MDYTIKELPQKEQPREKLREKGAKELTDTELVSIVLRTGIQGKNVKELSAEILNSYSLPELSDRTLEELKSFDGVSRVKAGQLKAVGELARRMQREERKKIECFPDVVSQVEDMKFMEEERLRVFYLSSGNEVLEEKEFEGEVGKVETSSRKIFRKAVSLNAAAIIIAHNHPSGRSEPTDADLEATEELIDAGESLDVKLLDHVIVGEETTSMRSSETVQFPD